MLLCVASLAPTNVGVIINCYPRHGYLITTVTSNGSPPTSATRLPAGILRVRALVSVFLHRLSDLALAAWVDVGEWIDTGPCGGSQGQRGIVVDGIAPRHIFLAGGLARSYGLVASRRRHPTQVWLVIHTYSADYTWWALADSNRVCFAVCPLSRQLCSTHIALIGRSFRSGGHATLSRSRFHILRCAQVCLLSKNKDYRAFNRGRQPEVMAI